MGSFNLPAISNTSPFFDQTPAFGEAAAIPSPANIPATLLPHNRVSSNDPSEPSTAPSDDDRPLTPPPARPLSYSDERQQGKKDDSPHRIPSLEFEAITFEKNSWEVKRAEVRPNPHSPEKGRKISAESTTTAPTAPGVENGAAPAGQASLAPRETKIRQRISREMIRERIDKKYEEGSITRRPTSMYASAASVFGETGMKTSGSASALASASTSATSGLSASTSAVSSTTPLAEKRNSGYSTTVLPPTLSTESVDKQTARQPASPMRQSSRPARPVSAFGALPSTAPLNVGNGNKATEKGMGMNKALPTPPLATPMQKSATEIPSIPAVSISAPSPASKSTTPTAATFSTSAPTTPAPIGIPAPAMDQIQRSARSGTEPKSALDKLISNVLPKPKRSQTSETTSAGNANTHRSPSGHKYLPAPGAARPVGILQNPTGRLSSQTVPTLNATLAQEGAVGDGNERGTPVRASSMLPPPKSDMDGAEGFKAQRPTSDIPVGSAGAIQALSKESKPLPKPAAKPHGVQGGSAGSEAEQGMTTGNRPAGYAPKARNASGISLVSVGSKKGRRSMSMSDAAAAANEGGDDDVPLAVGSCFSLITGASVPKRG